MRPARRAAPEFLPGPRAVCKPQSSPQWLRCEGNACVIERSRLFDEQSDGALLATNARIVPVLRSGQPAGLKVYAIAPCSRAHWLGLRNGDLISRVNGLDVTTPTGALQAYAQLRRASHFTVQLERAGHNVTFDYTLR